MADEDDLRSILSKKFSNFTEDGLDACLSKDASIRKALRERTGSDLVDYVSERIREYSSFAYFDDPVAAKECYIDAKKDGILSESELKKAMMMCKDVACFKNKINNLELEKDGVFYGGYGDDDHYEQIGGIHGSHDEEDVDFGSWGNIIRRYEQD
ncbi:MAG TPA: hypothetical protein ENF94_02085 [Candidatus Woesearchaeota archaeon]|nr:hypothetical protein [Candidatus Woesearchaeota archaeon]